MRGLTLVVVSADPTRFEAALRLAATAAAMGGRTRLFLDGDAVRLAAEPGAESAALLAMADELGVEATLCQTGLAATGLDLRALDTRWLAGGLAGLIATLEDDRLVTM